VEDGVSLAVRGDAGHDRVDVRLRRAQQNDLVHRRTRQETADGALGLKVGDLVPVPSWRSKTKSSKPTLRSLGSPVSPVNRSLPSPPTIQSSPRSPMIRSLPADPVS